MQGRGITRRAFANVCAGLAAIAATSRAGAQSPSTLRLIVTHSAPPLVPNSVLDLADSLGFYRREGLTVEFVRMQNTPLAIVALQNKYGDLADVSISSALQLRARRAMKLKAVLVADSAIPFLIASQQEVPSLKALEGRAFGIGTLGSLDYTMTQLVLTAHGVDIRKVHMVPIGQPQARIMALGAKHIDATTISIGVWNRFRSRRGLKVLLSAEDYHRAAPILNKVIVADEEALNTKRAAIESFAAAIIKASRAFSKDQDLWIDGMSAARPDVSRDELQQLAAAFAYSWSVNGGLDPAQVSNTINWLYRGQDFRDLRRVGIDEFLDTGPIAAVLQRLGAVPPHDPQER